MAGPFALMRMVAAGGCGNSGTGIAGIGGTAGVGGAAGVGGTPIEPLALVPNGGSNTVSVLDLTQNSPTVTVRAGGTGGTSGGVEPLLSDFKDKL